MIYVEVREKGRGKIISEGRIGERKMIIFAKLNKRNTRR